MPGIAGLITPLPEQSCKEKLGMMVGTMRHETFYSHGSYLEPEIFTYIGWTSHERSFTNCMPIFNEKRDLTLFLAGEVFSDSDCILELRTRGHTFDEADASYLIHLYEELGEAFFKELNGWFSGLLIDQRNGKTFLFNDRFGMQRVFFHHRGDAFFFSSEAKALLSVLPETRDFDLKGLAEFLTCGCTLGEQSLFKNIQILPGGSLLEFEHGHLRRNTRYFHHTTWEAQSHLSEEDFFSRFIELFPKVAQKYASSRTRVGMSLTGGFDSRMVLAGIAPPPGSLPCYTFGSMYRDTFDVKVGRQVAVQCEQPYRVLKLGKEFVRELPTHLEKAVYISDGYLGLSGAAELYANSLAREIAPIRLTGNYGSEVLRGVRAFKYTMPRPDIFHHDFKHFLKEAQYTFDKTSLRHKVTFAAFQQAPHQGYGRGSIERSQLELRAPFLDNELLELIYQAPKTLDGFILAHSVLAHWNPGLVLIPTDRGFLGPHAPLTKGLRRFYREALFKAEYWVGQGGSDWISAAMHRISLLQLDKYFLGRHKFYHLRVWLRERLASEVYGTLMDNDQLPSLPYISQETVKRILFDHFQGSRNYTSEIDQLLTTTLTQRLLLGSSHQVSSIF